MRIYTNKEHSPIFLYPESKEDAKRIQEIVEEYGVSVYGEWEYEGGKPDDNRSEQN